MKTDTTDSKDSSFPARS